MRFLSHVPVAGAVVASSALLAAQENAPPTSWGDPDLQGTYTITCENG